jgi:hypothetical protein
VDVSIEKHQERTVDLVQERRGSVTATQATSFSPPSTLPGCLCGHEFEGKTALNTMLTEALHVVRVGKSLRTFLPIWGFGQKGQASIVKTTTETTPKGTAAGPHEANKRLIQELQLRQDRKGQSRNENSGSFARIRRRRQPWSTL